MRHVPVEDHHQHYDEEYENERVPRRDSAQGEGVDVGVEGAVGVASGGVVVAFGGAVDVGVDDVGGGGDLLLEHVDVLAFGDAPVGLLDVRAFGGWLDGVLPGAFGFPAFAAAACPGLERLEAASAFEDSVVSKSSALRLQILQSVVRRLFDMASVVRDGSGMTGVLVLVFLAPSPSPLLSVAPSDP